MSRYDYYSYFRESQPRATDEGIKAQSKRGKFVKNWWAKRWIEALEPLMDAGRLRRGRSYARKGQVLSIDESKSEGQRSIQARVQGSRARPYKISITMDLLSDREWEKVIDILADQAIFTAQLLAGEMPQDIETAFAAAGVSLFPDKAVQLETTCSCPDWANPCKHLAAVHYILGEQFDQDPFMLFRLRGRTQEQILEALRARRSESDEDDERLEIERVAPLTNTDATFWEMGQPLTHFKSSIKEPATALPILKRLGQPSFLSEELTTLLGPVYQAITERAIATAFDDRSAAAGSEAGPDSAD